MLTTGLEPVTSSLPWKCSTVGAMRAKEDKRGLTEYVDELV